MPMTETEVPFAAGSRHSVLLSLAALAVQAVAAIYFVVDGIDDVLAELRSGITLELFMECVVAFALLLAVVVGAHQLRESLRKARRQDAALQVARGSMSELLNLKFGQWGLTASEAEVALFALKGCTIGEIARMRSSAEGTVRSQLSQVYSKAGVTGQPMLIGHFVEELL